MNRIMALVVGLALALPACATVTTAPSIDPDQYPSATECGVCHPRHFEEWRSSAHAYASISPMFHKFEQAINDLSSGTINTFCVRCHASVGTTIGEQRDLPIWERSQVAREGITCVTCHRVNQEYNRENGERRMNPGTIYEPVYGAYEPEALADVMGRADELKLSLDPDQKGRAIHKGAFKLEQIDTSEFCVSCHQVAVAGIKLEVVWEQYRASPARAEGITCQNCHMSKENGVNSGYDEDHVAFIRGNPIGEKRKHSNHAFLGPGYSIAHPGIFPHSTDGQNFSADEWLAFDYTKDWGTEAYEAKVAAGSVNEEWPSPWGSAENRVLARKIITSNQAAKAKRRKARIEMLEHSMEVNGPFFSGSPSAGSTLDFNYVLKNHNSGHNLPSGSLGAQPELWMNVALVDPDGNNIWESGYTDSDGDMCDLHSPDVLEGRIPHDDQLFNLQTKFLTTNVKGTDREMYLPVTFDVDQQPFIRPPAVPTTVLNHPPFVRMEQRSIAPLGSKKAHYSVDGDLLTKPGRYQLSVRMRSRAEPIYFMKFVGATPEMISAMNAGIVDLEAYTVEFDVK